MGLGYFDGYINCGGSVCYLIIFFVYNETKTANQPNWDDVRNKGNRTGPGLKNKGHFGLLSPGQKGS